VGSQIHFYFILTGKKETARNPKRERGRVESGQLNFFLLRRGGGGLRGLRLDEALLEFVDATGGIHKFLRAGVEGVAGIANADDDAGFGGTRLDHVAAGATDFRVIVFRMYVRIHNKKGCYLIMDKLDDKKEFFTLSIHLQVFAVRHAPIIELLIVNWDETGVSVCLLRQFSLRHPVPENQDNDQIAKLFPAITWFTYSQE
jgi:hypothetical protein